MLASSCCCMMPQHPRSRKEPPGWGVLLAGGGGGQVWHIFWVTISGVPSCGFPRWWGKVGDRGPVQSWGKGTARRQKQDGGVGCRVTGLSSRAGGPCSRWGFRTEPIMGCRGGSIRVCFGAFRRARDFLLRSSPASRRETLTIGSSEVGGEGRKC